MISRTYCILRNKHLFLFWMMLFSFLSYNQAQTIDDTVTAIELMRMNVVLVGVDNPVKIVSNVANSSDLDVSIDNGVILRYDDMFIIRPSTAGNAVLRVSYKGTILTETFLRVRAAGNVFPVILRDSTTNSIIANSVITKNELLSCKGISVIVNNSDFDIEIKIVGFKLSVLINDSINEVTSHDWKFSAEHFELFEQLEPGVKVYIEDITAIWSDDERTSLPPLILLVVTE